jgi:hypothetical protein
MNENTDTAKTTKKSDKDGWDKWQIILAPVGGLLTALAVGYLTFSTSRHLSSWQERENNARVYTELMSKREEAETGLRKAMFDSIMNAFLNSSESSPSGQQKSLEDEVLKMELLAYNFHESLNLAPLFKNLERKINGRLGADPRDRVAADCRRRLRKVATDVVEKQLAALKTADGKNSSLLLHGSFQEPPNHQVVAQTVILGGVTYEIAVGITDQDPVTQELQVSLNVKTKDTGTDRLPERHVEFWTGSFDFPMIDNTRLPNDQFCALVMKVFEPDETQKVTYELHGVCFPGSRAALQEKPYYDEILDHLRQVDATE